MATGKQIKPNGESEFFKRVHVCLKGKTLKMFEFEINETEAKKSARIYEIVKEHYRNNPPFGYGSTINSTH